MNPITRSVQKAVDKGIEHVACRVYLSANQNNLVNGAETKVLFNTATYDLGRNFDLVNSKFVVPVTGLYKIYGDVHFNSTSVVADRLYYIGIFRNGSGISYRHIQSSISNDISATIEDELFLTKDDYIELFAISVAGVDTVDLLGTSQFTRMNIRLITKEGIRQ